MGDEEPTDIRTACARLQAHIDGRPGDTALLDVEEVDLAGATDGELLRSLVARVADPRDVAAYVYDAAAAGFHPGQPVMGMFADAATARRAVLRELRARRPAGAVPGEGGPAAPWREEIRARYEQMLAEVDEPLDRLIALGAALGHDGLWMFRRATPFPLLVAIDRGARAGYAVALTRFRPDVRYLVGRSDPLRAAARALADALGAADATSLYWAGQGEDEQFGDDLARATLLMRYLDVAGDRGPEVREPDATVEEPPATAPALAARIARWIGIAAGDAPAITAAVAALLDELGPPAGRRALCATLSDVTVPTLPPGERGTFATILVYHPDTGGLASVTVQPGAVAHLRNLAFVARAAVTAPIAADDGVADTVHYADPVGGGARYVPRYELAKQGAQYTLRLARRGGGWALSLRLEPHAAPELAAGDATPITPRLEVALRYRRVDGTAAAVRFDELTFDGAAVDAAATLPTIEAKDAVYAALTTAMDARLVVVRTVRIATPLGGARFREADHELPWTIAPQPFTILPGLHPYVYTDVAGGASAAPTARAVVFAGKAYTYYQDPIDRERFAYLPDGFALVRRVERPRAVDLRLRIVPGPHGLDDAVATLGFAAAPTTRVARLTAAAAALAAYVPAGLGRPVALVPLAPARMRLALALPGGAALQPRPDAIVEMTGVHDVIELPLAALRELFDAMFSAGALLLRGVVTIVAGDTAHAIPFDGSLVDALGDVIETAAALDGAGGAIVTFVNAGESPATIDGAAITLRYRDVAVAGVVAGAAWPRTLAAGEELALAVAPAHAPPAGVEPAIEVALGRVTARPDRAAVLAAMYDGDVEPAIARTIKVKVPAVRFAAPADPQAQLLAVVVTFEHGATVDLDAGALEREATVRTPVADLLLDHADAQIYRYKLDVVRAGSRHRDADWRTDTVGVLYPELG